MYSEYKFLLHILFEKNVPLFCDCLFKTYLVMSSKAQRFSILKFTLPIFAFITHSLGVISRNSLPKVKSIVLALTLRLLINFKVIFVCCWGRGPTVILLHVDIQLCQHCLLKRLFIPTDWYCHTSQKPIGHGCMGLFWKSQFCFPGLKYL